MKQSEAKLYLRNLLYVAQKMRSIEREQLTVGEFTPNVVDSVLSDIQPWLDGDKSILPALVNILDRDIVAPMDFYNMMFVVSRWLPQVNAVAISWGLSEFPEPDTQWIRGWEEE